MHGVYIVCGKHLMPTCSGRVVLSIVHLLIFILSFAGRGWDPGRAWKVGAGAELTHSRAEKNPQWG